MTPVPAVCFITLFLHCGQAARPAGASSAPPAHALAPMPALKEDPPVVAARPLVKGRHKRPSSYKTVEIKEFGIITGTIRYTAEVPPPRKIDVDRDHETCGQQPREEPLIKVGPGGLVAETVVFLADIGEGKAFEKPVPAPRLDQKQCRFEPRVMAVPAGTDLEILNSDPIPHNIKGVQRTYTLFNVLQPLQNMRSSQKFEQPGLVNIKCNVHNWMQAFVYVFRHPYYHVTDKSGTFKFDMVPAGRYELVVWQEYLGEQSVDVEVKYGATTTLNIELEPVTESGQGQ